MQNEVVAHFMDGRIVKGTSLDVAPAKPSCHIRTQDGVLEVALDDLKALYYVKDLVGDPDRVDVQEAREGDPRLRGSRLVEIVFQDGERLVVLSNRFPPKGDRFFVLPIDSESNNERILINHAATVSIAEVAD